MFEKKPIYDREVALVTKGLNFPEENRDPTLAEGIALLEAFRNVNPAIRGSIMGLIHALRPDEPGRTKRVRLGKAGSSQNG